MASGKEFLKALKRIGYQEAHYLDESDFDFSSADPNIKSFLDVFCMLNEENVLTDEEIKQYSALTPAELADIEKLDKGGAHGRNDGECEKKNEILFLQKHLTYVEKHNKTIKGQIEIFKKHEENLLKEAEIQQTVLTRAKKRFQTYEMYKVVQAEDEFVSSLESIMDVAKELEVLIVHADANDDKLPTSDFFRSIIQQYLDAEEKIIRCVNIYMQNNFQLTDDNTLAFIVEENAHKKEFTKEAAFLKKMLQLSLKEKTVSEKELLKLQNFVKHFGSDETSDALCHPSQLKYKLEEATELNTQLLKKEEELETFASDNIAKHVDALFTEIDLCVLNETYSKFQFCIDKMSLPMTTLVQQRTRVETLVGLLVEHKNDLKNLKNLIHEVHSQIEQEQSFLRKRKFQIENENTDERIGAQTDDKQYVETVLSSLHKILAVSDDIESAVSTEGIIEKANKFFEARELLKKNQDKKMKIIDSVEKYAESMESLLNCTGKEYSNWHESQQIMSTSLNSLSVELSSLEKSLEQCSEDMEQKQKLLEKKGNLRLARNLFVYGLTNMELFKKCIDDVQVAIQNSPDY